MDLRYPHAKGKRARWQPLLNAYLDRFLRSTARSQASLEDFMSVLHLMSGPRRWLRPAAMVRTIRFGNDGPDKRDTDLRPPLTAYSERGDRLTPIGKP